MCLLSFEGKKYMEKYYRKNNNFFDKKVELNKNVEMRK
jgi:hypothetical protein